MATVTVSPDEDTGRILWSETVTPRQLADEHASLQIIERLACAVQDADDEAHEERRGVVVELASHPNR